MEKLSISRLLARFSLLLLIALPQQQALALVLEHSPYLQTLAPTQVTLRWRTDTISDSHVAYGSSPTQLTQVVTDQAQTTEHSITLTGLTADTTYYYSIGSTTRMLAGADQDHFFKTAPNIGSVQPVSIWVVGDSGTADGNARAVRDAYLQYRGNNSTDLFLMLGDNAYGSGTDSEYTRAVFDMYPMVLQQTPVWPTIGNHDARTKRVYDNVFTLPTNGESGGMASGSELFYSFDYANIHFVVLDSQLSNRSTSGTMLRWLESDLSQTSQQWIIAFWHHPPYTKGSHDSDRESALIDMRENALPILERYGVDLVLNGHSHSYERSYLLTGHYGYSSSLTSAMVLDAGDGDPSGDGAYRKTDAKGAVYVVAGSSGKTSGGTLNHPAMFVSMNRLGSMALNINDRQLDAVFINSRGEIRDRFSLVKGVATNQKPTVVAGADQSIRMDQRLTLNGSASDDGLPNPPGLLTLTWSKLNGPGTVDFTDAHALNTSAGFSQTGSYTLQLTANDGEYAVTGNLLVSVMAATGNQAPAVDAGLDIDNIHVNSWVDLQGSATDDGLPASPGQLSYQWNMQSGPGQAQFLDELAASTQVRFSVAGSYVLRLTVDDGASSTYDELTAGVLADSTSGNQAPAFQSSSISKPVATAGISYQSSLTSDASDPDGDSLHFSKLSGPAWLQVSDNGSLSGIPNEGDAGSNSFLVQVQDQDGMADQATLLIIVEAVPVTDNAGIGVVFPADLLTLLVLLLITLFRSPLTGCRNNC